MVEIFLQRSSELNIKFNARDKEEYTAFHLACKNGHLNVVELLMKKSSKFNIVLDNLQKGHNALALAFENDHLNIADLLVQKSTLFL